MKLYAHTRIAVTAGARDTNFVAQHLGKIFRPLGAKFVKQSGSSYFFRTEKKASKADILALLGQLPEATLEGNDTVVVNCQSPLGIIYEETIKVLASDDPDSRMFNIVLE